MLKTGDKITHWQLSTENIGNRVLDSIEEAIIRNNFGVVTLTAQDSYLIQIDIVEKIFFDREVPQPSLQEKRQNPVLRSKVVQALQGLHFGQVVFTVKHGKVTQIERNERTRWNKVEGLHGDGI